MKKLYSTPNLVKAVSLGAAMATLLSSVSPVFASNLALTGQSNLSTNGPGVSYPYGSHGSVVFAGDDNYCGADNVVGRGGSLQQSATRRITAEQQYNRFIENTTFGAYSPYGTMDKKAEWTGDSITSQNGGYMGALTGGTTDAMPQAFGIYSFATGCGSSATGNYSTAFGAGATTRAGGAQAFGVSALASGKASVAMGVGSEASGESAVAVGGLATASGLNSVALGTRTKASKEYTVAIGSQAEARASGAIAIGGSESVEDNEQDRFVIAYKKDAIAIGSNAHAAEMYSIAIGSNAQVRVKDGVAIGGGSVSLTDKGVLGYDPATNKLSTKNDITWKSTAGAFSVGEVGGAQGDEGQLTRQITGVAAGTEDTDAVNVAQLKALRELASGEWKLSVNGKNETSVKPGTTVDFSVNSTGVGKDNLKIEKDNQNKIKFALSNNLKLTSVVTGRSTMSDDGFIFKDGARIGVDGIDAGNKTITGVAEATQDNEAVNYKQLNKVKDQIAESALVKWDDGQKLITIGARKDGTKIDIAGSEGDRTISGVKAAVKGNEAVNKDQLDSAIVDIHESVKHNILVKQDKENGPITVGKERGGTTINIANKSGDVRTISGVKAAENDDEAVNKKQLDDTITDINDSIKNVSDFSVRYDKNDDNTVNYNSVTLGGSKNNGPVALRNVKDGRIAEESHDAINGSQINKISKDIARFFGGGTEFNNGAFSGPQYNLSTVSTEGETKQKVFEDVGSALTGLDANVKNVNSRLTHVSNEFSQKFDGLTKDALLWSNQEQAFVALHGEGTKTNSKLTFLKDGDISEESTDAINGSQLFKVVQNTSKYFGGSTDVLAGIEPAFLINGKEYRNVTDAFTGVNLYVKNIDDKIIEMKENNLVQQESISSAITIGAKTAGTEISIAGVGNAARSISGVKAAEKGDEAVNKDQLDESIDKISKDALLWSEDDRAFVALHGEDGSKTNSKLTFLKDGDISEESTDAINGSQINTIAGDIANYFGSGASFENGVFKGPKYSLSLILEDGQVGKANYTDVGSALKGLDGNIQGVNNRLTNVSNEFNQKIEGISKDALLWSEDKQAFVALHGEDGSKTNSKITYLLDGDISEESTDAINGSQINTIAGDIANYFGGGTSFENGAFKGPKYSLSLILEDGQVGKANYTDVGSALKGLDGNIQGVNNRLTNVSNEFNQKIEDISKDALLWSEDDRAFVALHGEDGSKTNSKLTFLKDGDISEESTDAINGSQINTIAGDIANYFGSGASFENGVFKGPKYSLSLILEDGQVGKANYTDVGSALKGLDGNIQGVNNRLTNVSNEFNQKIEGISKDALLWSEDKQAFVALHGEDGSKTNSKITYLLDGDISEESTDAINGSQINTIAGDIANYFGGGTSFENGAFKGPKYSLSLILEDGQVGKANYHDVGSALKGLDGNIQGVNNRLTNVSNEFNQKIEDISKDALLWSEDEQAFVALHGEDGSKTNSKLKFLLDGDISSGSTDAITGNQLFLMSNQLAAYFGGGAKYENGQWIAPNFKITQVDEDGKIGEKKSYDNVAEAFDGVNNGMSNINNRIDDVIKKVDSDALKWNENKKAYDASRNGKPSKITGVANGKVEKDSKDAVNGGQLWETNERITGVEKDVKHLNNRVNNISNTIADIGETVLDIDAKVDDIDDKVNDIAEDAVRYDRDKNGKKTNKITLVGGNPSEPVTIDKVADGKIASGSKQAINGGQLHDYTKEQMKIILDESKNYTDQRVNNIVIDAIDEAVERANNYTNMKFEALNYSIENVRKEARQAAAIGLAVSNLRYNDTPGKLSVGFGSGLWRSQSAFAFGAGYTSEKGNIRSNISVTTSGGHWGVGAGFNMTLN
ncbi:autotransporter adhesin [Bartonella silvatica]|uniref:Autotransporter adhesin n=1 Tax=Bartonella silvatica TaxID=357760 RepID=A0ABV2HIF0_9HYPH